MCCWINVGLINCLCSCLLSLIFSAYSPEWSSAHVSHRPVRAGNHSRHYQERELIHCCLTLMERFIQTSTVDLFTSLNYPCKHRCWVSLYFNHYEENSRAFGMLYYFDLLLVIQYVLRIGFGSFVFPLFSKMFKRSCTNLPVSVLNTSPVSLQNKWFRPQSLSQVLRLCFAQLTKYSRPTGRVEINSSFARTGNRIILPLYFF